MTKIAKYILSKARALKPVERAEIIEGLYSTFDFPAEKNFDAAWAHEVENRIDAYEEGLVKAAPAANVFSRIGSRRAR
jgi:putative addiction module component (TIGR02574 family)